jgi:hypothetical protein
MILVHTYSTLSPGRQDPRNFILALITYMSCFVRKLPGINEVILEDSSTLAQMRKERKPVARLAAFSSLTLCINSRRGVHSYILFSRYSTYLLMLIIQLLPQLLSVKYSHFALWKSTPMLLRYDYYTMQIGGLRWLYSVYGPALRRHSTGHLVWLR